MSIKNCKEIVEYICDEIRNFTDIAVVGLSGGADSTLVSTLCVKALGKENVYGLSMPFNQYDKDTFNSRSEKLANRLGINHYVRSINEIVSAINEMITIPNEELTDVNSGNSRSRARMCVLYGFAHGLSTKYPNKRIRVMGTGNLSEDFIGYDTKGGDALADIFIVGELFKSEIYQLLEYFRDEGVITEDLICRTPSAGLEDGQTDEGDLGYTYDEMEPAICCCMDNYKKFSCRDTVKDVTKVEEFVWERHVVNKHKHEAPPVLKLRKFTSFVPVERS